LRLPTLSFFEYLQLRKAPLPPVPDVVSLADLLKWKAQEFTRVAEDAKPLTGLFHDYLLRGGFPQAALLESIPTAQKLLREDIVDKVLKRDMTALFGVRRVLELEQVFLYLCLHDGGLLDLVNLCKSLELTRSTVANFIDLLEATHLIYRLMPFGYGKEVLRGRPKVYLADPAIGPSVLLKGKALLEDATALGNAVETALFKHLYTRLYQQSVSFSYWRGRKDHEVDMVASVEDSRMAFEVKYRTAEVGLDKLRGLTELCESRKVDRAYVITRSFRDFGHLPLDSRTPALKIPAPLACFWLGSSELAGRSKSRGA
jgi:predicted AAA+ superfamily ATPase